MHDDDARDLRRFADDGDEAAFAAVVQRHLGLVHAAALRQVNGDAHLAHDVAQSVFTDLARKAGSLAPRAATLAGWLYTSTHHAAAKAVRTEQRRRRREQEAHAMQELSDDSARDAAWAQVRPHLDTLMQRLGRDDREMIVQRFFANRSFADLAAAAGVTESGARMRVDRALEKLRVLLERRGIRSSVTVLGSVLATEALAAPPAGLAASVTAVALAQAGAAATAAGALGLFGMTKIQTTILAAAAATGLVVVSVEMNGQREHRAGLAGTAAHLAELPDARAEVPDTLATPASTAGVEQRVAQLRREKAALEARLQAMPPREAPASTPARAAAAARSDVYDYQELDVKPEPLARPAPVYPFELKALGVPGEVRVSFVVSDGGDVTDMQVEETSHPAFADVALAAVAQWKFKPGQINGVPVNVRLQQPLAFAIHTEEWF